MTARPTHPSGVEVRIPFLSPLTSVGRSGEVTHRIRQAIQLGLVGVGEQLPNESDLAKQLGVSPMTLREALSALREQGLVETRRGRGGGTFVRGAVPPTRAALRRRLRALSASQVRDLGDEHLAICAATAQLAAQRASTTNIRRLTVLTDQLASAPGAAQRIRADSRFHIELAIASHSERLTRLAIDVQSDLADLLWAPGPPPPHVPGFVTDHRAMTSAIMEEDAEQARHLAVEHALHDLRRLTELHLSAGAG